MYSLPTFFFSAVMQQPTPHAITTITVSSSDAEMKYGGLMTGIVLTLH